MFGQSNENANKPICPFYQKGCCKYGNKCWKLHTNPQNARNVFGGGTSSSVGFSSFGGNTNPTQKTDQQFMEFVKQVTTEMNYWEKNGLWPLSFLAPLKDHPVLAGFVDTSPEELRVEAYEANKANNIAAYQTSVNEKLAYHKHLREALKNQLPEAIEALKCVFYKTKPSAPSTPLGGASTTNMFGGPSSSPFSGPASGTQPSMFGVAPSSSTSAFGSGSSFGGGSSIFGNKPAPQSPAFGAAPVFESSLNQTLEGGGAFKATTFGNSTPTLFGGGSATAPPAATSSLFGGGSQNQGSAFGGSSNVFGSSQNRVTGTMFGAVSGSPNPASSSIFGGSAGSSFGTANSGFGATSIFGSSQQNPPSVPGGTMSTNTEPPTLFAGTPSSANSQVGVFGGGMASGNTTNLFGGNQNQATPGIFGGGFGMNQQQTSSIFKDLSTNTMSTPGGSGPFGNSPFQSQTGASSSPFSLGAANEQQKLGSVNTSSVPSSAPSLVPQTTSNSWFAASSNSNQSNSPFGIQVQNQKNTAQSNSILNTPISNINPPQNVLGVSQGMTSEPASNSRILDTKLSANQLYTPLDLLTPGDREEFQRDTFIRIPLVPPPQELCF